MLRGARGPEPGVPPSPPPSPPASCWRPQCPWPLGAGLPRGTPAARLVSHCVLAQGAERCTAGTDAGTGPGGQQAAAAPVPGRNLVSPKSGPASPQGETAAWPGPSAAQRAGRRPGPPRAGAGLTAGVRAAETEGESAGAPGSVPREGRAPGKHPTRRAAGGQATRSGREKLEARWLTCPAGLNQR